MWQIIPPSWRLVLSCLRLGPAQETLLWRFITGLYWHSLIFNILLNILGNRKKLGHRGRSYIWVYYCQICNKDSFCKSEEILPPRQPPLSPVFVRSFNPVLLLLLLLLLVVWGLGWGRGGGGRWTLSLMSFRDERTYCDNQNYTARFFFVLFALFVCSLASELFTLLMFFSSLKIFGLREKSIVTTLL